MVICVIADDLNYNGPMRKSAQIRIALLVLMLAVSHVALISHVTAHFTPELEQCELCVSQAQLLTAIPCPDHDIPVDTQMGDLSFSPRQCVLSTRRCFCFQQRAPPISST